MLLGYARAHSRDELNRQVAAVLGAGVAEDDMHANLAPSRKDRPRHRELLQKAKPGDVVVVETLLPRGLPIGETLALVRDWAARGVGSMR